MTNICDGIKFNELYYCGYVLNADKTLMCHIRNSHSKKIDLYTKVTLPNEVRQFGVKDILAELVGLILCHYIPAQAKQSDNCNAAVFVYQDKFGKVRIQYNKEIMNPTDVPTIMGQIATREGIDVNRIVGRYLGTYDISNIDLPSSAEFKSYIPANDMAHTLAEYYVANESISCELIV